MMRMGIRYSKLSRLLVCFLMACIFIYIVYNQFHHSVFINVWHDCKKIEQTEDYCTFNCSFYTNASSLKGRITVCHSAWASIFEKEFILNKTSSILIKLPRRNYAYWWMRAGFYNMKNKKLYEYGMLEDWLNC